MKVPTLAWAEMDMAQRPPRHLTIFGGLLLAAVCGLLVWLGLDGKLNAVLSSGPERLVVDLSRAQTWALWAGALALWLGLEWVGLSSFNHPRLGPLAQPVSNTYLRGLVTLGLVAILCVSAALFQNGSDSPLVYNIALTALWVAVCWSKDHPLWAGLGLVFPPLLVVGACLLARPTSLWARRLYQADALADASRRYQHPQALQDASPEE